MITIISFHFFRSGSIRQIEIPKKASWRPGGSTRIEIEDKYYLFFSWLRDSPFDLVLFTTSRNLRIAISSIMAFANALVATEFK